MSCLFCQIAEGKKKSYKVYEDEKTFAFLDVNPASKGHTLIITKKHAGTIFDIDEKELRAVINTVKKISVSIKKSFNPKGVNIIQSNGSGAGQEIEHFHMHVVPRYDEDNITIDFNQDPLEDPEETLELLSSHF